MGAQRPNLVGWLLVGFFLIGGIGFWLTIPEIFIGQIWVAVWLLLAGVSDPVSRLTELARLKDARLISAEEFDDRRKRVLDGL